MPKSIVSNVYAPSRAEEKLKPVMVELAYNLESFNPAFTAVLLKVRSSKARWGKPSMACPSHDERDLGMLLAALEYHLTGVASCFRLPHKLCLDGGCTQQHTAFLMQCCATARHLTLKPGSRPPVQLELPRKASCMPCCCVTHLSEQAADEM